MNILFRRSSHRFDLKSHLRLGVAGLCLLGLGDTALAAPAVFFTDDLENGETLFTQTVLTAAPDAVIFSYDLTNATPSNFSVTSGDTTVYVRTSLAGAPANYSSNGFQTWSVNYGASSDFDDVVNAGYVLEFFSDIDHTDPFITNAVGLITDDWGTCCTGLNTTPSGAASGSAIYMVFDPFTAPSNNFIGNITSSIPSTNHFVAAIDDRNSFSSISLAPNGSGEFFGAGGYLMFSFVPIGSVEEGSSYVDVGDPPSIPDIDLGGPYTNDELNNGDVNPVFDGGELRLSGGGAVTADFLVNSSNGDINTNGHDASFTGVLSGPGGLVKTGDGVLTLTGANTFAGGLGVTGGAVSVGSESALGAGGVELNGGALITTASFNTSKTLQLTGIGGAIDTAASTALGVEGEIAGAGRLVKTGAGSLTLAGANSFAGGVDILEGFLVVGADSALGDTAGDIVIDGGVLAATSSFGTTRETSLGEENGRIDTAAGVVLTHNGQVGGVGRLVKTGAGALTLAGANSFAGGVDILNGFLVVGADSALGDAAGDILIDGGSLGVASSFGSERPIEIGAEGGVIAVAGSAAFSANGHVAGEGQLIKRGAGDLILTADNTLSGGVKVEEGAVIAASDSALGANGAVLTLDGGALAAALSFTIERNIEIGATGGSIDTRDDVFLVHNGDMMGAGSLIKTGAGRLALNGQAEFTNVSVVEGALFIHSAEARASRFQVMSGASLFGNGSLIGDVVVGAGGLLSPGASPGVMTVTGDVTLDAGSTFLVEIDGYGEGFGAGNYDRLVLLGADSDFTAAGTLSPVLRGITGDADNAFTPTIGDVFTIVTTEGAVTGNFDSLIQPSEGMAANTRFEVIYGADVVQLYVTPQLFDVTVAGRARLNGRRAAQAMDSVRNLDGSGPTSAASDLFHQLHGLDETAIAGAFQQLSGEIHVTGLAVANRGAQIVRDGFAYPDAVAGGARAASCGRPLNDRAAANGRSGEGCDRRGEAWIAFSSSLQRTHSDNFSVGYDDERYAVTAGINVRQSDNLRLDLVGGYTRGDINGGVSGRGYVETTTAAALASARVGGALLTAAAGGTYARIETNRTLAIPGNTATNDSDENAMIAHLDVTASLPVALGSRFTLTPFAGFHGEYVSADAYEESGPAAYSLYVSSEEFASGRTRLGAQAAQSLRLMGLPSTLSARGAWRHELNAESLHRDVILHDASWQARSASIGHDIAELSAMWKVDLSSALSFGIEYQGQFSDRASAHEGRVGLSMSW